MASSFFATFCDALLADLQANVRELTEGSVLVHRYATYDPEQFLAEPGDRHLAVWPADSLETAQPIVTGPGGDVLNQVYQVAYWENAGDEAARGLADTEAAAALLELIETIRARLYAVENVFLGGAEYVRYLGTAWSGRSGSVRWFQIGVGVRTSAIVG